MMNKTPKKLTRAELTLFMCQGSDCKKNGAKKLRKAAKKHVKNQGWKKRVNIIKTKCMDGCKRGPICHFAQQDEWLAGPSESELLDAIDDVLS